MSAKPEAPHGHDEHGGADHDDQDHDHHAEPPLPEPASPAWLPLLGGALFLLGLLAFLVTRPSEAEAGDTTDAPAAAEPTPAARPTAVRPDVPPAARPMLPDRPGGTPPPTDVPVRRLRRPPGTPAGSAVPANRPPTAPGAR
ncbi:MAG TPA: hypothetical protein VIM73_19140 [Polyangiaceae bacterium]